MKRITRVTSSWIAAAAALVVSVALAPAQAEGVSFKGKTITILVGFTTGGSTDIPARLIAPYLAKYLPGKPGSVVQNMPGARGMTAANYFAQKVKPDGLTASLGSSTQLDPVNYRVPQSRYDPSTFPMIGGVNVGGSFMIIRREALRRLTDKSAPPIVMASVGGFPRSGMQMAAWGVAYLGWNARWVAGYPGSSDLILALKRGEIDMTSMSLSNVGVKELVLDTDKQAVIYQTGMNRGTVPTSFPALVKTPLFVTAMAGKITDPVAKQAFEYWRNVSSVSKWLGLPPKTPEPIVAAYRDAFRKTVADPGFMAKLEKVSDDITITSRDDLTNLVRSLAETPPEALGYMTRMLNEQGLKVEAPGKKKKKKKKKKKS